MSVVFLGTKSVGAANLAIGLTLPSLSSLLADILSRITALNAQIASNGVLLATPPSPLELAAQLIAAAANALAAIPAIIASIPAPLISANVSLAADLAALNALRLALEAAVSTLTLAASAGGLHVLQIDSTPAAVGGELAGVVGGGIGGGLATARIQGVLLVTESPATFSALSSVLLTG